MARILIGWELGGGHGHTSRLLDLAAVLAERGHTPLIAPQQIGPFATHGPTWQPPIWPRLLAPLARTFERPPATMGDILAYLGLDDPAAMAAMLMAWDRVLRDAQPDAVVAEYAPILQLAARGRIPVLGFGTGFSLPPAHLSEFPSFTSEPAVCVEPKLLAGLNAALQSAGRASLAAMPAIFTADRNLVASFDELDPYREQRSEPAGAPALSGAKHGGFASARTGLRSVDRRHHCRKAGTPRHSSRTGAGSVCRNRREEPHAAVPWRIGVCVFGSNGRAAADHHTVRCREAPDRQCAGRTRPVA